MQRGLVIVNCRDTHEPALLVGGARDGWSRINTSMMTMGALQEGQINSVKGYQMPAGDVGSDGHARLIAVQEAGV